MSEDRLSPNAAKAAEATDAGSGRGTETGAARPLPAASRPRPALLGGFAGGLAGGIVTTAGAAALLMAFWPSLRPLALSDIDRRLEHMERAQAEQTQRLTALEAEASQYAPANDADSPQALAQRVAALESRGEGKSSGQSERLAAEVDRLSSDLQGVKAAIPPEGTILRLVDRAAQAERQARALAVQTSSTQAQLLVVGQLRDAIGRGDPYQAELLAARRVVDADTQAALDGLVSSAAAGIPRVETLMQQLSAVTRRILDAEALPDDDGVWTKVQRKARSLISVRRVDGEGDDTEAIVARAEKSAGQRDLAGVLKELTALRGPAASAAQPWIKAASSRIAADRSLSELSAGVAAGTAALDQRPRAH
ncbi:MAG: hypothetical protein F8N37_20950 [Telmatospirillum sp.]|nr:hypothetical protein [Telmatospirillum sp.]